MSSITLVQPLYVTPLKVKGKSHGLPVLPPPVVRHPFVAELRSILSATVLQIELDAKICLIQGKTVVTSAYTPGFPDLAHPAPNETTPTSFTFAEIWSNHVNGPFKGNEKELDFSLLVVQVIKYTHSITIFRKWK